MVLFLLWTSALVLTTGCKDDNTVTPPPDPKPVIIDDPDQLMQFFLTSYNEMDFDLYTALLHPDFRMMILPSTVNDWAGGDAPLAYPYFTRDETLAIHANIFSGNAGQTPLGSPVPPVATIDVDVLQKDGIWELISEADPEFAGQDGYWVAFNVLLYFNNPDNHRFEISQVIEFYVAPIDVAGQESWHLLGIRGLDSNKILATENTHYCGLLSLYRAIEG